MRRLRLVSLFLLASSAFAGESVDEIVVTSSRTPSSALSHTGNISRIDEQSLTDVGHAHIHELMTRIPGVWISRGSGQESLPSIRSPVLTGAGSCGAFQTLEDGLPSRPGGFCNVNQLFELPTELAESIEVIRGPSNALYGSNALHGMINVLLPEARGERFARASIEAGANEFVRLGGSLRLGGSANVVLGGVFADDGGFRADSGYDQAKAFLKKAWDLAGGSLLAGLSASYLDQETAGFIQGKDAYEDPAQNRRNLNPEAFRNASSQRLMLQWRTSVGRIDVDIRPYVRNTAMEFLQHFLPGKPLEENAHTSLGVLANFRTESDRRSIAFGFDVDLADISLKETQFGPTEGSAFLQETRPVGRHYDFGVRGSSVAGYFQSETRLTSRVSVTAGLRAEYAYYDYDNRMLGGNTRDDGSICGFGGCLYSRPESRSDNFLDVAPKLGMLIRLGESSSIYANLARGFRAPQMTELYRLQSGQAVADLDSETIDSLEIGIRGRSDTWRGDAALFAMQKRNSVYRDSDGFNVSGGRSRHVGVEFAWDIALHDYLSLKLAGSVARHTYDFDTVAARGESFESGNDVDTAPRWNASGELGYHGPGWFAAALQWVSQGEYYLDAENAHRYRGTLSPMQDSPQRCPNTGRWYCGPTISLIVTMRIGRISHSAATAISRVAAVSSLCRPDSAASDTTGAPDDTAPAFFQVMRKMTLPRARRSVICLNASLKSARAKDSVTRGVSAPFAIMPASSCMF